MLFCSWIQWDFQNLFLEKLFKDKREKISNYSQTCWTRRGSSAESNQSEHDHWPVGFQLSSLACSPFTAVEIYTASSMWLSILDLCEYTLCSHLPGFYYGIPRRAILACELTWFSCSRRSSSCKDWKTDKSNRVSSNQWTAHLIHILLSSSDYQC